MITKTSVVYTRLQVLINVTCIPFRCHGKIKIVIRKIDQKNYVNNFVPRGTVSQAALVSFSFLLFLMLSRIA